MAQNGHLLVQAVNSSTLVHVLPHYFKFLPPELTDMLGEGDCWDVGDYVGASKPF
jgi:hypothetical protein